MLKKLFAAALILLCASCALAQDEAPLEPLLPAQESALVVEALFRAATGVTFEGEWDYRDGMTLEQRLARNDECADYRAKTLPWLIYALTPEGENALKNSRRAADVEGEEAPAPVYTTADGYAAFESNELGLAFLAMLKPLGGVDEASALALSRRIIQEWMAQIDHEALKEMNEDYLCWIYAPGTQIDYPIVQHTGNDYYLNHLFDRRRNAAGTLFIDYRNLPDFADPNTIIYGHHMRNDSMFGTLTDYEDQEYFEANPYMLLFNGEEITLLEIFSGYVTDSSDHCYDLAISGQEDKSYFIRKAEQKSNFNTALEVTHVDRIVTLSTCAYVFENARYVVLTRQKPLWQKPEDTADEILHPGE